MSRVQFLPPREIMRVFRENPDYSWWLGFLIGWTGTLLAYAASFL